MKGYIGPSVLCAVLLFGAVLLSPAFADMKEVSEAELARTNVSVTGTPLKHFNCVEKDGVCGGMNQDYVNSDKGANDSSSFASNSNINDVINLNLNIKGDTTFQFYRGATNTNMIGGITSVTPR